ncbi:exodeoxyribonuclease VII small subunit [Dolosigranulum pigrum]|jgi:exodeoxyribonuclease VII small subunit|uniref:Exodeoxyribonuclease 7 small subunit n=2 Tax=Dolosigranulum pigrum TaxID=29394 RepID=H3NEF9_9LACT|nr:exodeoxyribonuclease VII small subunit [Dolosigranulum pigrum]EHR32824.1 exodeoxyribonuclease VII, small subunit [Dolosigranulum pigrum ATCC 51524]OOL80972.1 exodeoxyribonuclease VII small subunit [Dolosigranulum pigrum]QDO91529.1 exodeoxyribonuclease VII small subunit [Dolosigranulum pigrum]QJS96375.1 exodeoxyribonuclease VII small subunit [Dolosigranulum pigrum]QJS98383.1 exodeoxyribonuclease VII small subunit [Dolosigranulum pigrum]
MSQEEKTFDQSLQELEAIVETLEQGDVPLEEALEQFQQGIQLSQRLKTQLNDAEKFLKKIVDADGQEVPLELE